MNNRQNGRRRGRGGQQARNGQPGGPDRGNRLDNRARGNAAQLLEKYKNLARDAQMQGDRVNTEYYLQFADHYFRVLNENRARFEEQRPRQQADYRDDFGGDEDGGDANSQQRYQADREQGGEDGWDEGEQPQAEQRQPRRERQAYRADRNEEDGEREERAERPERSGRDSGGRSEGVSRERGRRGGNGANGNGGYANGNGNGFSAPDFLSEPISPRREFQQDGEDASAPEAVPVQAEEAAPKPKRVRAPRRPRAEGTAEA
jgi:hypothetical protein